MLSARLERQGCLSPSLVALAISTMVACVLRYWHQLLNNWTSATPHDHLGANSALGALADTTAVVLNWSRFPNVRTIANLLCAPELAGILHTVLVWNNNPMPLSYADFDEDIGCSPSRLHIVNSPQNLYFQARFLACMSASTTFCYTQDDDYLVLPEILKSLHARISEDNAPQAIYLLPPHEHQTSELRYVCNEDRGLHTSFAWLGHGALVRRSLVKQFLALMQLVNATEEQLKMADNYFSILLNQVPEVWFDQGIELGGGQAFTVGSEGEQRNRNHIMKAGLFLDSLLDAEHHLEEQTGKCDDPPAKFVRRAPCVGRACLLESSIRMLPVLSHTANSADEMLLNEEQNLRQVSDSALDNYTSHALSKAVDADQTSAFRSLSAGKESDYMMLDMLSSRTATGMSWLVDEATTRLLRHCIYEMSADATIWFAAEKEFECSGIRDDALFECYVPITAPARYFRALLKEDVPERWTVYDLRLRIR